MWNVRCAGGAEVEGREKEKDIRRSETGNGGVVAAQRVWVRRYTETELESLIIKTKGDIRGGK